jgi:dienelactone hydrolase
VSPGLRLPLLLLLFLPCGTSARADESALKDLAERVGKLDSRVFTDPEDAKRAGQMIVRDQCARRDEINRRSTEAWKQIHTREEWEAFRDGRIKALPPGPYRLIPQVKADAKAAVFVAKTIEGDGYRIRNIIFEGVPGSGIFVTANLYGPAKPGSSVPGIIICHSHHAPKHEGELQDMGVTWAKLGCYVLVMDQLGHGERRVHPFVDAKSYPQSFRVGRQDYYFRYNLGLQLASQGDSLMGWMVREVRRAIDVLLDQPGIDASKIIVLGSVAGGGDPAAVTAAQDERIEAAVVFNFGGPQPETRYPLPENAEATFNYMGGGSWESTRNLEKSGSKGFLPWVIVGSIASRRLVYAHEFSWDREHDPVWKRLERIYELYGARDNLAAIHGRGLLSGKPPEATHCTNIGPEHRKALYPILKKWFDLPIPEVESRERRSAEELACWTPEMVRKLQPESVHDCWRHFFADPKDKDSPTAKDLTPERRQTLLREWSIRLQHPAQLPPAEVESTKVDDSGPFLRIERIVLHVEREIRVPVLLLLPPQSAERGRFPIVVGVAQEGNARFLKGRSEAIARLLSAGVAVCLPDLRGVGETSPGLGRDRASIATTISSTEQMLGGSILASQLLDLRLVLGYLGGRCDLDGKRIAIWGEGFARPNPHDQNLAVPLDVEQPHQAEPLGGILAALAPAFHSDVAAVVVRGGLVSYRSLLDSPFCCVPHDAVVFLGKEIDLPLAYAARSPRPLRIEGLVDGLNRRVADKTLQQLLSPVRDSYARLKAEDRLQMSEAIAPDVELAEWFLKYLNEK